MDLPAARGADDRGDLARARREADVAKDGVLGAGVAELDVAELDVAGDVRARRDGCGGVADGRLDVEDGLDALGRGGGARDHREHHGAHHDGHEDHRDVGEVRGEVADGHRTARDPHASEPHHGDRRQVQDAEQRRDHEGEDAVDLDRGVREVGVGDLEAALLVVVAHERANHAHARERLAGDLVDAVDLDLHRLEQRHRPRDDEVQERRHQRQHDDEDQREHRVLAHRHDDAADAMTGARIIMFSAIITTIWTCWTSLVLRVMSDGVPNWLTSVCENVSTLRKMAARTSRPNAIDVFEPK